ncbi:hypothetical protein CPB86DRAFT_810233 [Serendipita vermifera]|nr:hypothetical protein CPB86DRAFT_810233 [Serendipita vermifera]
MDPRRAQSAQARVYSSPQHPPPGAAAPRYPTHGTQGGLLNAPGPPHQYYQRDRTNSSSSADYYAAQPSFIPSGAPIHHEYPQHYPSAQQQAFHQYSNSAGSGPPPPTFAFPEPQMYRSMSAGAYRPRRQETHDTITPENNEPSSPGFSEEYFDRNAYAQSITSVSSPGHTPSLIEEAFTQLSLDQDAIKKFQQGQLNENEEEWHRLVDPEARASLESQEVKRQSVIFEAIKSEKDYVADLEALQDVFLRPLMRADPPVIAKDRIQQFVYEVFWNFDAILARHQRLVAALFERQRDQHPIIQNIGDIILEATLAFREDYESYIKHYPLAEARHRREMRRNPAYQAFLAKCSTDQRVKKRDLITFISRAVTRLPRLKLILESVQKYTPEDHPDAETLPVVNQIMSEFLKSTQPGIAAAESRVKFVTFCENLTFKRGELIDMDLYGEHRTMVHSGTISRKDKAEAYHTWGDYTASLLDHYFIITKEEVRGEITKHYVVSRPIPLDFLRLGPFIGPGETRREGLFGESQTMYPFVVSDGATDRRYTLYTNNERERTKWKEILEETMSLREAYVDANKLFAFEVLSDGYMRERTVLVSGSNRKKITGLMRSAVTFNLDDRAFIAVAAEGGIYIAFRSDPSTFTKVLDLPKVTLMSALVKYDRLVVLNNGTLLSFSLFVLAKVAQGKQPPGDLDKSLVKLAPKHNGQLSFFRIGKLAGKDLLVYDATSSGFGGKSSTLHTLEFMPHGLREINKKGAYLPGVALDVRFLNKVLAIVSDRGMTILDPYNIEKVMTVPDFSRANTNDMMMALKEKCDASRTLGIVPIPEGLMCIYEEYGCYITKYGQPTRNCGFVRWEIKAKSFVFREPFILLFGENFVEIRHAATGQFRQMVERRAIRLLDQTGLMGDTGEFLIAWKGEKNDDLGQSDALVEVLETRDLTVLAENSDAASLERSISAISAVSVAPVDPLWDEWS